MLNQTEQICRDFKSPCNNTNTGASSRHVIILYFVKLNVCQFRSLQFNELINSSQESNNITTMQHMQVNLLMAYNSSSYLQVITSCKYAISSFMSVAILVTFAIRNTFVVNKYFVCFLGLNVGNENHIGVLVII